jgi:hypothetical protein
MAKGRKRHAQDKEVCPYCGDEWNTMGLSSHVRACKRKQEEQLQDLAYNERLRGEALEGVHAEGAGKSSIRVLFSVVPD